MANFRLNHAGMAALLKSGEVRALLTEHADIVLAAAKADPHDDTGDYEAGLHIEQVTHPTRAVVRVVSGDWKGRLLEARYGILARALGGTGAQKVLYRTRSGKTRWATQAQVDHWTRGR